MIILDFYVRKGLRRGKTLEYLAQGVHLSAVIIVIREYENFPVIKCQNS